MPIVSRPPVKQSEENSVPVVPVEQQGDSDQSEQS